MGSFLDRCGIAPAIAAILAPTSLALFPWNVPIVLNIQFSRSRKYFLLYTPNMKFSLLVVTHFLRVACKPAAVQRGLGRAPQICVWISKRYASKTICQQVGGFWAPLSSQSVRKPAGRVNHAMIHSLPAFPVHSEKVNHSMIHFLLYCGQRYLNKIHASDFPGKVNLIKIHSAPPPKSAPCRAPPGGGHVTRIVAKVAPQGPVWRPVAQQEGGVYHAEKRTY